MDIEILADGVTDTGICVGHHKFSALRMNTDHAHNAVGYIL